MLYSNENSHNKPVKNNNAAKNAEQPQYRMEEPY
ncbi:hypothetical protein A359_05330 [secondary endosymbiont of Ctenarytaina eucalypti]|uniref:Uncharacterized protein n=1 Tax=secondary endosymbiont of Ctenarytaina eucalypti TaxID=1199245 RepID=J3TXK2_9ENTR|nr:hypothetical protein A359_05330 [secondary endosymbiont of Ctenarytaina eucalypti]